MPSLLSRSIPPARSLKRQTQNRPVDWLDSLAQDVRYGFRALRRSSSSSVIAVVSLAIGIGVNVAVFSVTNAVLFKGFRSVGRNDRILYIGTQKNGRGCCASYPDFEDWRAQAKSFQGMGAVADLQISLNDSSGAPEHYDASLITANAFRLLGATPLIGREFAPSDDKSGAAPVAILSHGFWQRRYGTDPDVVGRTIRINGTPTTVIGVMPEGFSFPAKPGALAAAGRDARSPEAERSRSVVRVRADGRGRHL
jgi:putative ABC transport system permease protein